MKQEGSRSTIEQAAARLLKFRLRSEWELKNRLWRKGFSELEINKLTRILKESNLIDDLIFARAWIRNRNLLKPTGRYLLKLELRQKKVSDEVIEKALKLESKNDQALAFPLAKKKIQQWHRLSADKKIHKLNGFLQRRGFNYEIIQSILNKLKLKT